jgi:hypothetical protein
MPIEYPNEAVFGTCSSLNHYTDLLIDGECFKCGAKWGLSQVPTVAAQGKPNYENHEDRD